MRTYFGGWSRWRRVAFTSILLLFPACGLRGRDLPVDRTHDARIQDEVEARIRAEPSLRDSSVRVVVEGGSVRLHGSVQGIGAWKCAITNAELVAGVRGVIDYLVIERGERDVRCLAPLAEGDAVVVKP